MAQSSFNVLSAKSSTLLDFTQKPYPAVMPNQHLLALSTCL